VDQDRCDRCGALVTLGAWPFCPHGEGHSAVIPDDVPGGFTVENGFDSPRTFYSRKAHRDALAAEGMTIRAKWAGPNDKYLTRWDVPSQKTLDDARILLSRGRTIVAADDEPSYPIETRVIQAPWPTGVEHG
jgi:hypothetical protein